MTPRLLPRNEWAASLERFGCRHVRDADALESHAELWRSPAGTVFLVPYIVIPDDDERRVADYSLKKIIASLKTGKADHH